MLTTRFFVVPMSSEKGGGVDTVEADAGTVGRNREDLGAVAAVDLFTFPDRCLGVILRRASVDSGAVMIAARLTCFTFQEGDRSRPG
jgi:hypothetical protein